MDEQRVETEPVVLEEVSQAELRRRIFAIVWPVTLDSVLVMLVNFVSTGLVGRLGSTAVSVVGLSSRITQFAWALFSGISTGTTVLVARAVGAKDREGARHTAVQAIVVSIGLIIALMLILVTLAEPLLLWMNAEGELLQLSLGFLSIAMFTLPLVAIIQVVAGVARGMGDTRTPMLISFAVNIINAASGWILIYGRFGFPTLGLNGAAVAALISQGIGALLAMMYISSQKSIGLRLRDFRNPSLSEALRVLRVGLPASAEMVFWQMATMVMMSLIMTFGTVSFAAHQLGLQAESISYMPGAGFGIAATALIGHSLGARNPALGKRYFKEIMTWGVLLSGLTSLLLFFFNTQLLAILTDEVDVIQLGAFYLWLMSFTQVPSLVAGIIGGTLRSAGDVRAPMVISGVCMWLIRIPLSLFFGGQWVIMGISVGLNMGVQGVWWAMLVEIFVRLGLSLWRYSRLRWDAVRQI